MAHDEITFIKLMQAKGLRITEQRLLILDAVCAGKGHTTIGEILLRVKASEPSIDQSTVYRTLDLLCKLGLVAANPSPAGGMVYEIVGQTPHHHLLCTVCGREYAVPQAAFQSFFEQLQAEYGFTVTHKHLILEGLCENCRQGNNELGQIG